MVCDLIVSYEIDDKDELIIRTARRKDTFERYRIISTIRGAEAEELYQKLEGRPWKESDDGQQAYQLDSCEERKEE